MTDATRRTIRTGLQALLGLLAALPLLVSTAGIPETLPGIAVALTVAGAVTRVMALPVVEQLLPAWLRTPKGDTTE
ncbi:hypothetical protein [Kitasatospora sp. A2-31]|uniref:hypothetical protein n=1 Tax=Kitasatospora sp. A2-31 TaxID=2916414 RepID=UPI001EEDB704|nr:hypothetical protein [Kitasatospora sp. A2-31]MCG6499181.1 hypothetical protein [Kitasatospora sp. A2-31]